MRHAVFLVAFCAAIAITSPAQIFTNLADFDGANGANPFGAVTQAADGNFYGTTYFGGANCNPSGGCGTVFKMTPEGFLTTLYNFCSQSNCTDGAYPYAGLVQAADGNLYGTTEYGGDCPGFQKGCGTIFEITLGGTLTTLHSFDYTNGAFPDAGLVQATDDSFYGTTGFGGTMGGWGTVFKFTPPGTLAILHSFDGNDGGFPFAGLVQGTDGSFYGTTSRQGTNNSGTVFKITVGGILTTLYSFCSQTNCTDGGEPLGALVQGTDGDFYGTTASGGLYDYCGSNGGCGTVFKITSVGTLTTLYSFCPQPGCPDGAAPYAGLVQAPDGNFYGTTPLAGGEYGDGTVFRITPEGVLTIQHTFNYTDGSQPSGALVPASDGNLYGTTASGGIDQYGTVFRLFAYAALSVSKSGMGTVSGGEGHIYCGDACSYIYDLETQVGLSAVPAAGYTFTGWTGCDNVNGSYCYVTMTQAKNVTAAFDAANVTLTSLSFKPGYVKGGQLSAGTLMLSAAAPPGGVTVALSSDHPGVAHVPSFVFVPGGKSSVQFAVDTLPVKSNTTVTITATAGSSHISGALMVGASLFPPSLR